MVIKPNQKNPYHIAVGGDPGCQGRSDPFGWQGINVIRKKKNKKKFILILKYCRNIVFERIVLMIQRQTYDNILASAKHKVNWNVCPGLAHFVKIFKFQNIITLLASSNKNLNCLSQIKINSVENALNTKKVNKCMVC